MTTPVPPSFDGSIPPYVPVYGPMPNITPFTYRDGMTYLQRYEALVRYIQRTLIPWVDDNYEELSEAFAEEVQRLIDAVNAAIEAIINDSIEVQDPVVAALIADPLSATHAALMEILSGYADKETVDELVELVTNGRLSEATLDARFEDVEAQITAVVERITTTVDPFLVKTGGNPGQVYTKVGPERNNASWHDPFTSEIDNVSDPDTVVKFTPDKWHAPLGSQLTIPTYDGSGRSVHPSVVYIAEGWNGYEYWMAMTPYPAGNATYENPSIIASHDGVTWVVPNGLTNPIEGKPNITPQDYNSDPDLILGPDNRLYVFYRYYSVENHLEILYMKHSLDGVTWAAKQVIYQQSDSVRRLVSPSFIYEDGGLTMFAVDIVNPTRVMVTLRANVANIQAITPASWSPATLCTIDYTAAGKEIWHISVKKVGGTYVALLNDSDAGVSGTNGDVYLATSTTGIAWDSSTGVLIPRDNAGYHNQLYRATFVPEIQDSIYGLRIWYSAYLSTGQLYNIFSTFAYSSDPVDVSTSVGAFVVNAAFTIVSVNKLVKKAGICIARLNIAIPGGGGTVAAGAVIATIPVGFRTSDKNLFVQGWGDANGTTTAPLYYEAATHAIKSTKAFAASSSFSFSMAWDVAG